MSVIFQSIAPVLLVKDVAGSAEYWATKVGFEFSLYNEPPTFAILWKDDIKIMLAQVGQDVKILPNWRVVNCTNDVYIWIDDVKSLYEKLTQNGTNIDYTLYDTPWGTREFGIQDLDDHDITFGQVLEAK